MTVAPALGLVAIGVAVACLASTISLAAPANAGPVGALVYPALENVAVASTIGVGVLQVLGGTALLAAGWS